MVAGRPLAFNGVPLDDHNSAVASAIALVFSNRLRRSKLLSRRLDEIMEAECSLCVASVLSGALHDIGKSSPKYQEGIGRGASFWLHEMVGASIIVEAGELLIEKGNYRGALLMRLVSWAVARHHSAMEDRHP
ncbi:MAG: HD domain-containing protein, partial [Desulfurococcales archaeon]|nr:HD domain-containing protein [Desulfurococcales archaeon]